MRQDAQKSRQKFCAPKTAKKRKTHPEKPEKGETGCVLGAGEGSSGWRRMRPGEKPGVRTKVNTITMQHVQKENRQKPNVFAGFLAGAEGLDLRSRSGRLVACVPPARTRPSARGFGVDVGGRTRERKRAGVARFLSQVLERAVLVWCCGKFPCVFYDLRVSCFRNSLGEQPAYF